MLRLASDQGLGGNRLEGSGLGGMPTRHGSGDTASSGSPLCKDVPEGGRRIGIPASSLHKKLPRKLRLSILRRMQQSAGPPPPLPPPHERSKPSVPPFVTHRASRRRGVTKIPWRREDTCQNVASLAHVVSISCLALPDVSSGRGATTPSGVTKTLGVTRCGVRTRRHEDWRQNVASKAHVASWPHVSSTTWRHERGVRRCGVRGSPGSQHVPSKCIFRRRSKCAPKTGDRPVHLYVFCICI